MQTDLTRAEIMAATPEQLDLMAADLMGTEKVPVTDLLGTMDAEFVRGTRITPSCFAPSKLHDHAAELLERVPNTQWKTCLTRNDVEWRCSFVPGVDGRVIEAHADTMPLAITRAVLLLAAEGHLETKT